MENQDKEKSTKASRNINIPRQILLNILIPIGVFAALIIFVFSVGYFV